MEEKEAAAVASGAQGAEADKTKAAPAMKVVAAVDASEESLHALSWALDNVVRHHAGGAALVVVHAQHGADYFVYPVAAHGIALAYHSTLLLTIMHRARCPMNCTDS